MVRCQEQAELPLRERTRWGGRRRGAGRPAGTRPRMRHRPREPFAGRFPCHVTLKMHPDVPSLRSRRLVREVERSLARARRGRVFADRYHLHVLRTPKEVRHALRYVLLNARKHARRVVRSLRCDPASSGRWFDGWRRAPVVPPGTAPQPAVASPRTWLLRVGWRGLIDPADVPGRTRAPPGATVTARAGGRGACGSGRAGPRRPRRCGR